MVNLFVSTEAKAAQTAKLEAVLIERDGNEKVDEESKKQFKTITAFSDVNFEASTKRKSEDEPEAPEVCCKNRKQ